MTETSEPATRPTRRARSDQAILEATRELLDEHGVRALTIEGVAERSGVAKTTIYRRYRDRDELALAVLIEMSEGFRAPPDLRDTRKELLAFVNEATDVILKGGVIEGLASEIATNPNLGQTYRDRIIKVRWDEISTIIARGVERGDLRPDTDVRVAHEVLIGPLMYRLLFNGLPLLLLAAAYAAVAGAVLPSLWRERSRAHPLDWAIVLVFAGIAVAADLQLHDVGRLVGDQGGRSDGSQELLSIEDRARRVRFGAHPRRDAARIDILQITIRIGDRLAEERVVGGGTRRRRRAARAGRRRHRRGRR